MLTILHISDLHFGMPYLPEVGEAVLRAAPALKPDAVVVSGDLTQRARDEEFAAARAFLDRLPDVPRVVVPGNHDVPLYNVFQRFGSPFGKYRRFIDAQLEPVPPERLSTRPSNLRRPITRSTASALSSSPKIDHSGRWPTPGDSAERRPSLM